MKLLYTMLISMSLSFMWMKTPISMGVMIIMQTVIISLICGMQLGTFWMSYIIMIVMLSGMLVLFIYMASIASNQKFNLHTSMYLLMMIIMLITLTKLNNSINNEDITENKIMYLSLNCLFNTKFKIMTISMILLLFLIMISVSSIVNISEGPLRVNKK
uniref:NADH dehydrogenase subunit 6 n=1 Tax=Paramarcius puncticeps TaxID=2924071 RepID=UPI001FA7C14C|nr:NADH dehydrogenase subunit 6 [Paramarcius puncticeps]UMY75893.1 NADH dehydrogenase subunit 6 [Paramarcius puncticeps]